MADELDDLLNSLETPTSKPGGGDDLDALLSSLSSSGVPPSSSGRGGDDLDHLINQMDTTTSTRSTLQSQRGDTGAAELDALINGLGSGGSARSVAPAPVQAPPAAAAPSAQPPSRPPAGTISNTQDDLDRLIAGVSNVPNQPRQSVAPSRAPVAAAPKAFATAGPLPALAPEQNYRGTAVPAAAGGELDLDEITRMTRSLNQQMRGLGDGRTASKGVCAVCRKDVLGESINAGGKIWHAEHFSCSSCNSKLSTTAFHFRDGAVFCPRCFGTAYAPPCAGCGKPATERCITALERKWHAQCFLCAGCHLPFTSGTFLEGKDHLPYCQPCFYRQHSATCAGCNQKIMQDALNALNQSWHAACFKCAYCNEPFGDAQFWEYNGRAYCETHYHQQAGAVCGECQRPIVGQCISVSGTKYHINCLKCAFCQEIIPHGRYEQEGGKHYCTKCKIQLFG